MQGLKREPHSPEIRQTTGTMCMKTRCDASWDPMQAEAPGQLRTETHGSGQVQTRNNSFTFPERQRTSQPQIRGRGLSPPGACRAGVPPCRHGPKRESKSTRRTYFGVGRVLLRTIAAQRKKRFFLNSTSFTTGSDFLVVYLNHMCPLCIAYETKPEETQKKFG